MENFRDEWILTDIEMNGTDGWKVVSCMKRTSLFFHFRYLAAVFSLSFPPTNLIQARQEIASEFVRKEGLIYEYV